MSKVRLEKRRTQNDAQNIQEGFEREISPKHLNRNSQSDLFESREL